MAGLLIAIVGDVKAGRVFDPPLDDPSKAEKAAEQLGMALAEKGARLLVYGGPFLEQHVVRGFIKARPKEDHSILMWYTQDNAPPAFEEEEDHPKLFQRHVERGADWEVAFYRSIVHADGLILMGGGNATKISGQIAIGARMPILALREFGGGAAKVWESLSAGEDLPTRDEIDLMARTWCIESASSCVDVLSEQNRRRKFSDAAPRPALSVFAAMLFLLTIAIVSWITGRDDLSVWMLFFVPLIAGGAGAAIRPVADWYNNSIPMPAALAVIVLGFISGGIAGFLFINAQFMVNVESVNNANFYSERLITFAACIGFVAGLTSDRIFRRLRHVNVLHVESLQAGR